MKIKSTLIAMALSLGIFGARAQTSCVDMNGYVNSKNQGLTGYYTLIRGFEEYAAQTYHYSGSGKVDQVRVYGHYPGIFGGVPLRISIYNVDANGRPTSVLGFVNRTWWGSDNTLGYINVNFNNGGVTVNNNFAVEIEILNIWPFGSSFQLQYTGDGEGQLEDLASLAGTSTGFNWTSANVSFDKEGDFYLVPTMNNFITTNFTVNSQCTTPSAAVGFINNTMMTKDNMFNTIALSNYSGTNHFYVWNFGDGSPLSYLESPTHAYSTPGNYTVTLTSTIDGWNYDCSDSYSMNISVGLGISATTIANVSCHSGNDGSITAVGSGGAPPYTYSLDGSDYQSNPIIGGLEAGNYTLYIKDELECTQSLPFSISEPVAIVFSSTGTTNSSCGNADGSILILAIGGAGSMQYNLNSGSYQSSGSFSNLNSGSYTVIAKDANGCTNSLVINVNDLGSPELNIMSTTNVSCNNGNDGSLILLATGGSGVLHYSINGGANYQTSGSFPALVAGAYALLVKDAAGCISGTSLNIAQPSVIEFDAISSPATCYGGNNGAITISSVIGGIGTYTYSINGTNYQSGAYFQGLIAGTYTVYVKDVASCIKTTNVAVGQPTAVSATITLANESCNFSDDGTITIVGAGGSGNYTYSINDHELQPSGIFYGLQAGIYKIRVQDGSACPYITYVTINQPPVIAATSITGNSTCGNSNGSILITATGGSGAGYQYSLDGETFNSTGSFTGKPSGTYYIYIIDSSGCINVASATIIDSNGPVLTSTSHTNVSCNALNDGTITINTVTGGTGTLEYTLNGENWKTLNTFTGLYAGTYTVMVRDANGCTGTESITLTEPNGFIINTTVIDVLCSGYTSGAINITAAGGAGTMAYSINGGLTFQSSAVFNSLSAGIYDVIVRDAAGCKGVKEVEIVEPEAINIIAGILNVSCFGLNNGALTIYASGGTGSFHYSIDGSTYQSSNLFSDLDGGTYTVYVKDANNCVTTKHVTITEPSLIILNSNITNVACKGGNGGVIDLSVSGGTGGLNYSWSNGFITEDAFNLSAGVYSVIVSDVQGCSKSNTYSVVEPLFPLIINGIVTAASTSIATDGGIDIVVNGGTLPYYYTWSNSFTTEDISSLPVGVYGISVTDGHSCTTSNVFTVTGPVGITTLNSANGNILIYPNPANDRVLIESNGLIIQKLKVMNVLGQVVYEAEPKNVKVEINTTTFEQGAYLIQIYTENKIETRKVNIIK